MNYEFRVETHLEENFISYPKDSCLIPSAIPEIIVRPMSKPILISQPTLTNINMNH